MYKITVNILGSQNKQYKMSTDVTWEDKIGDFKTLTQKAVLEKFGTAVYLYILACRSRKHLELTDNDDEYTAYDPTDELSVPRDPYFKFETFDQVLNPKPKKPAPKKKAATKAPAKGKGKGKPKKEEEDEEAPAEEADENAEPAFFTYEAAEKRAVKDPADKKKNLKGKDGKVKYETVVGLHKVKKFATVGIDLKKYIAYLFNKFLFEAHQCFEKNGKKFAANTGVLEQVCTYVNANYDKDGLTPFIVAASELVPVDNFIDDGAITGSTLEFELVEYLLSKAKVFFKDSKNNSPTTPLTTIITTFVNFLKVVSILYMEGIWGKSPGAMHIACFESVIRQLYVLLNADERGGHSFQYEIYSSANEWVAQQEEAAKKERESKAKAAAKGGAKGKGRKPKGDDDDEEPADDDGVDAEVDELADEEGGGDEEEGEPEEEAEADEVNLEE